METFWTYLVIGAGSALGGMGRYGLARFVAQRCGETLPWGTLFINVSGSFAIGLGAALALPGGRCRLPHPWSLFLLTGVSGGYTTFSAFSLQTLQLAQAGAWVHAGANVALSLGLCLAAVALGYALGQAWNR